MNDYAADTPVWWEGLPRSPSDLGLSAGLAEDLLSWAREFEDHYSPESGSWHAGFDYSEYVATANELRARLLIELGPEWQVQLRLWESDEVDGQ
jgi:hypothetical protein